MAGLTMHHVMASNQRLLRQIHKELFEDANKAWVRVYSATCKQHGELMPDKVMQFKYQGVQYALEGDMLLRTGVKQLHPSLVEEFKGLYEMFVTEVNREKEILTHMLSSAFRIAKFEEDLLELLPKVMHSAINESGYFSLETKALMQEHDKAKFLELYEKYFDLFEIRKTIGRVM